MTTLLQRVFAARRAMSIASCRASGLAFVSLLFGSVAMRHLRWRLAECYAGAGGWGNRLILSERMNDPVQQWIAQAQQLEQAGRLAEAEALLRRAVQAR